ncbi:MAG: L-threonine 3-dehydrogenase [Anaerolineae bacterium]
MANVRMMRAVLKANPGPGLELREVPVPEIGQGDVLIRVVAASICGTDVHIYEWDDWSAQRIRPPVVLGHEFAGVVEAIGPGVADLQVGTPVSAEGHILAPGAGNVVAGQEHLARDVEVIGIDRDGAFAEYVAVPRRNVWVNPADMPPEVASLQDPFGNAVHTVFAHDVAGQTVLVTGVGLIGLMAVAVARAAGARLVIATDVNSARLQTAMTMGANVTIDARGDVAAEVSDLTGGMGADILLEMSGAGPAITQGLEALRPGGRAAALGLPAGPVDLDWATLVVLKGITLKGIYGRRMWDTWHRARGLLESGAVDLRPLITHQFPLAAYDDAFAVMLSGAGGKVILRPRQDQEGGTE